MVQSGGFNLKNVVRHLPGGDTSLRRMYASHGVPMKASTDGRSEKFAIAIAQRQWTKSVWRSINPSKDVIDVGGLGVKKKSYSQRNVLERYLLPTETCKHSKGIASPVQTPGTPVGTYGIPSGPRAESFFIPMSSSNSVRSIVQRMSSRVSEHTARYVHTGDASGPRRGHGKWKPNTHKAFFLIHLRFPKGDRHHQ